MVIPVGMVEQKFSAALLAPIMTVTCYGRSYRNIPIYTFDDFCQQFSITGRNTPVILHYRVKVGQYKGE